MRVQFRPANDGRVATSGHKRRLDAVTSSGRRPVVIPAALHRIVRSNSDRFVDFRANLDWVAPLTLVAGNCSAPANRRLATGHRGAPKPRRGGWGASPKTAADECRDGCRATPELEVRPPDLRSDHAGILRGSEASPVGEPTAARSPEGKAPGRHEPACAQTVDRGLAVLINHRRRIAARTA